MCVAHAHKLDYAIMIASGRGKLMCNGCALQTTKVVFAKCTCIVRETQKQETHSLWFVALNLFDDHNYMVWLPNRSLAKGAINGHVLSSTKLHQE